VSAPGGGLRRELHFWEAIALSIAIMAPTAAMALNGATVSAFASALGTATAGSRVLFALSRDGLRPSSPLARISTRSGAPVGALALVMAVGFGGLIAQRIAGTNAVNAFFYPGTIGVLSLMVAYIVTNIGAIRHLFLGVLRRPLWQLVFPCSASRSCASRSTRTSRAPPRRTATSRGTCSPGSRSAPWFIAAAPHVVRRIGERLTSEIQDGPR